MFNINHVLIVSMLFMVFLATVMPTQAQRTQKLTNDTFVEDYKKEVRDTRPSVTYTIFEPAITFFSTIYLFFETVVSVIAEMVSSLFNKIFFLLKKRLSYMPSLFSVYLN